MGGILKGVGIIGWILGAWLIYAGLSMGVVVNPDGQGYVANFQLMHVQQMNVMLGALAVIEGTICLIGGLILERKSAPA